MKIGIFTDAYYPIISGVATSISTLYKELTKLGHDVTIVTFDFEGYKEEEYIIRIPGLSLPMKGLKSHKAGFANKKRLSYLAHLDLDLVHLHTEFTIGRLGRKYAIKHNLPIVNTYHTMYEDYVHFVAPVFKGLLRYIAKKYSRSFAYSANEVIFPTVKVKRKFDEYHYQGSSNIIPSGIYLDRFKKINFESSDVLELRRSLGIKDDDFVFLFIGRLSREKSIDNLIHEFEKVHSEKPNTKLLMVGGGPDLDMFKKQIRDLKMDDHILFTGMIPYGGIAIYYQLGDLFVNFSTTETQGLTYIEALASGVPLLVKYDDNLEDVIVDGYNGFSFTNDEEFKQLFFDVHKNNVLFNEITRNTTKSIEKFSAQTYGKKVHDIYTKLYKE